MKNMIKLAPGNFMLALVVMFVVLSPACSVKFNKTQLDEFSKDQLDVWNKNLTDVMVQDIFSPPVASRIYVYSNIAAYEILCLGEGRYQSLSQSIDHLGDVPKPDKDFQFYLPVAAVVAFAEVAQTNVYSYEMINRQLEEYLKQVTNIGIPNQVLTRSVEYGREVAAYIVEWASKDGYKIRNNNSQILKDLGEGSWQPTPPDFMEPIEPNWNTLRTFILDSASQFSPGDPTTFSTDTSSLFFKECRQVYETVNNASDEQIEIAQFWDCNPNASLHTGHVMQFQQKISPGAHWMLIASVATRKKDLPLMERARVFASLAISMADGFISCWTEKYRTVVIRPETYINSYIDKSWRPILQTPAFPEYTSGHSVVSGASATMLTMLLGDNFDFTDDTEVEFGLPIRSFDSFNAAANEAAISRLYGGIHYMPAIKNGVQQGRRLGAFIYENLN